MPPRRRKSAETTLTTETTTETASARGGGDEENADARAPAKKIKSRSGQRKKKTTNAAEALKDIGTNAVNAEEDGVNAEEDAAAREGSGDVFDLLRGRKLGDDVVLERLARAIQRERDRGGGGDLFVVV